jgi:hypothetical protein
MQVGKPKIMRVKGSDKKPYLYQNFKNTSNFKRNAVDSFVKKQGQAMKDAGFKGTIAVALKYPTGWKRGYFTEFGAPIYLYEYADSDIQTADPDSYSEFTIFIKKGGKPTVGNTAYRNDCFWQILDKFFGKKNPSKHLEH